MFAYLAIAIRKVRWTTESVMPARIQLVASRPVSATANVTLKAVVATSVNTATGTLPKRIQTVAKRAVVICWVPTKIKDVTSTVANASANVT